MRLSADVVMQLSIVHHPHAARCGTSLVRRWSPPASWARRHQGPFLRSSKAAVHIQMLVCCLRQLAPQRASCSATLPLPPAHRITWHVFIKIVMRAYDKQPLRPWQLTRHALWHAQASWTKGLSMRSGKQWSSTIGLSSLLTTCRWYVPCTGDMRYGLCLRRVYTTASVSV